MTLQSALLVTLGAAAGAPVRYLVSHLSRERLGGAPPLGTLLVNVAGSFVLGMLVGTDAGPAWLALLGTGFCGALTTFSTLALEIWDAISDERPVHAASIVGLSLGLGLAAAVGGYVVAGVF